MDKRDWDYEKKELPNIDNICLKCGTLIVGERYTVVTHKRGLVIRRAFRDKKGMHQLCAQAWVLKIECTPENVKKVPAVAEAVQELELIEQEGKRYLDTLLGEIRFRREKISDELESYHRSVSNEVRTPKKENSRDKAWPIMCVEAGLNMASAVDGLRAHVVATTKRLQSIDNQLNWIAERFQKDPPQGINPIGWVWKSEGDLAGIMEDAKFAMSEMEDLVSRATTVRSNSRSPFDRPKLVIVSKGDLKKTDEEIFEIELSRELSRYPEYDSEYLRDTARNMHRNAEYSAKDAVESLVEDARSCDRDGCRSDAGAAEKFAGLKFCQSCRSNSTVIQLLEDKVAGWESFAETFEGYVAERRKEAVRIRNEIDRIRQESRSKFSIIQGSKV